MSTDFFAIAIKAFDFSSFVIFFDKTVEASSQSNWINFSGSVICSKQWQIIILT